jgi:hypothetical protein
VWPVRREMYILEVGCKVLACIEAAQDRDPAVGFCTLSNEPSNSIKGVEFLAQMSYQCLLLKNYFIWTLVLNNLKPTSIISCGMLTDITLYCKTDENYNGLFEQDCFILHPVSPVPSPSFAPQHDGSNSEPGPSPIWPTPVKAASIALVCLITWRQQ